MDLFSKRLRKQHERSSLHARQLNKNAMTLLQKQLQVLEQRKQQNTRAIVRTRQAILQELTDFQKPDHEELVEKRDDARTSRERTMTIPQMMDHRPSFPLSSSTEYNPERHTRTTPHADPGLSYTPSSSLGFLDSDMSSSVPHHHGVNATNKNSFQVCRFRALSPLNPCPYFPCRRPQSYHRLKVSDIPDIVPLKTDPEGIQRKDPTTALHSTSSPSISDPQMERESPDGASRTGGASARGAQQVDGHISPRTSINDRLRGLKQLVRELRDKNEEKRPRDWVVNYGEPVSRRLLRKPAVPVSDEQF